MWAGVSRAVGACEYTAIMGKNQRFSAIICILGSFLPSLCIFLARSEKKSRIYFMENERRQFEHVLLPKRVKKVWKIQKMQVIHFIETDGGVLDERRCD